MLSAFDPGWNLRVALALSALVCALVARALWNLRAIPQLRAQTTPRNSDCMVVIPARNEESVIARAVRSLPHDSVIVVDDHSEDATAELASKAGAGVIPAPDPARGANAKSNACMAGARALESRWILFTDADTWFEPGFLDAAIAAAGAGELAFLSIHLEARAESWTGAVLAPLAQAIDYAGMRPRRAPGTAFRAQCILVRRSGYQFVSGHAAILDTLADDARMAALAARHRLKFGVVRAGAMGHAQFRDAARTIRRNGYRLLLLDHWTAAVAIAGSAILALWPLAALWVGIGGKWLAAAALLLVPVLAALAWYRNALAVFLPLAALAVASRLWSGVIAALRGRAIEWKGRRI